MGHKVAESDTAEQLSVCACAYTYTHTHTHTHTKSLLGGGAGQSVRDVSSANSCEAVFTLSRT